MNAAGADGGGADGGRRAPVPPASPRVRLEAALLDADRAAPAPAAALDGRTCPTVLVVAREADIRRYVRECLRERAELRVVEAATVAAAVTLAAAHEPACLVVDRPERGVLDALASHPAVLLVDDVPRGAPESAARLRLLARPFTAAELVAEVDRLIG